MIWNNVHDDEQLFVENNLILNMSEYTEAVV